MYEKVRPLADRVAVVQKMLDDSSTYDEYLVVLSMADSATLRVIEAGLSTKAAPIIGLREKIAGLLIDQRLGSQARDVKKVDPERVEQWAYGCLEDNLPGWTDFQAKAGGQYVITFLGEGEDGHPEYGVSTPDGIDSKRFRVRVDVQQIRGGDSDAELPRRFWQRTPRRDRRAAA